MKPVETQQWRRVDATLRGFFRPRVAEAELREDLVQEVLMRMHERREQLREGDRLEAWAFRIARNVLIDHRRRPAVVLDPIDVGGPIDPAAPSGSAQRRELADPSPSMSPGEGLEPVDGSARILGAWLRKRIAELPADAREALELTELEGLSQREAAERLGLPYSTLKSRVQRGRDRLHADLLGCCAVELDARGKVTDFHPRSSGPCGPCGCGD